LQLLCHAVSRGASLAFVNAIQETSMKALWLSRRTRHSRRGDTRCLVQSHWPELIPLVRARRLKPERFITHRMTLNDGPEAYRSSTAIAAARLGHLPREERGRKEQVTRTCLFLPRSCGGGGSERVARRRRRG
jgi:hypothetical protein